MRNDRLISEQCNGGTPCNNCERRYPPVACAYALDTMSDSHTRRSSAAPPQTLGTKTDGFFLDITDSDSAIEGPASKSLRRWPRDVLETAGFSCSICKKLFRVPGSSDGPSNLYQAYRGSCGHTICRECKSFHVGATCPLCVRSRSSIELIRHYNDPRVTLPKADDSSVQVNRTVDAAGGPGLPSIEEIKAHSSKGIDENDKSNPEKVHPPTWEDHVGTASGVQGIGRDIYTETDPSLEGSSTLSTSAASYSESESTSGEDSQHRLEPFWFCHRCGDGPMSSAIPACTEYNCFHHRCSDCTVEYVKIRTSKTFRSWSPSIESVQPLPEILSVDSGPVGEVYPDSADETFATERMIFSRSSSSESLQSLPTILPVDSGPTVEVCSGTADETIATDERLIVSRSSSEESLQSLVSIFSSATISSASTAPNTNNAIQRVLAILKADADLKILYGNSITKTSVDKFNRNLGRLLKRFGVDLEAEAKCWDEHRAARFIRSRARFIAQKIVDSVYPPKYEAYKVRAQIFEQDKAESSDDSDFEEEPDEFAELETFITSSAAFCKLRDNIRGFLGLEPSQEHTVLEASSCKLLEELPFAGEDYVYTIDGPVCYEQCPSPYLRNLWQMPSFSQKIRDFLFPEPPIAEGMSRVRWQCVSLDTGHEEETTNET
jgi:hypothetical protein